MRLVSSRRLRAAQRNAPKFVRLRHGAFRCAARTLPLLLALQLGCGRNNEVADIAASDPSVVAESASVDSPPGSWPWWRGPARDNHAASPTPPTTWSEDENIRWAVDLPGEGHSTPIVWEDEIFVTVADADKQTQSLVCLDRSSGSEQWITQIHDGPFLHTHNKNSHASPSPATDGVHVFTLFAVDGGVAMTAVDYEGNIAWQRELGPFYSKHGYGASPVIYKSLVIAVVDHLGTGYLVAVDRTSGEVVWQKARQRGASFATPIVAHTSGRDQLLISGQGRVVSHDPASGEEIWHATATTDSTANTMVVDGDLAFASAGWPENGIWAIRTDGSGNVTDTHVLWQNRMKLYVPSPIVVDDQLVAVRDDGVAVAFDKSTGDKVWIKRLAGDTSASPTAVEGICYLPDEDGVTHVFRAGDSLEKIAANDLGDEGFASPVIVAGAILLRTRHRLYCIAHDEGQR